MRSISKQVNQLNKQIKRRDKSVVSSKTPQDDAGRSQQNLGQQNLVRKLSQEGDWAGAIDLLTNLIHQEPQNAIHYNNRGLLHFRSGNQSQALKDYNYALELAPHLDSAYNNRANYYATRQDYVQAIADYETTLELNPLNSRAWINLGITYRDMGMYHLARENFDIALLFHRLEGNIYAERGRTHHLEGDWNWAIADYQKALTYLSIEGLDQARRQVERWMQQLLTPQSA